MTYKNHQSCKEIRYSQTLESLYLQNNTHSMWQGIQSVTNYKRNTKRTKIQNITLPDSLNKFNRFDRVNTDTPSKSLLRGHTHTGPEDLGSRI